MAPKPDRTKKKVLSRCGLVTSAIYEGQASSSRQSAAPEVSAVGIPWSYSQALAPNARPRSPPPAMDNKSATILYQLDQRKFKDYESGRTLYGADPLFDSPDTLISVRTFSSNKEASVFFTALKSCKGDRVAECRFIDDQKVIMDRVEEDLGTWITKVGNSFAGGVGQWWRVIGDRFISVFRDASRSLQHIHHKGYVCGNLKDGVQITKHGRLVKAKLINVEKPSSDLRGAKRRDVVELKTLMIQMLMQPFAEEWNGGCQELESRLNDLKVPYDIKRFILILHEGSPLYSANSLWLLDDSCFWTSQEKLSFIMKLYELLHSSMVLDGQYFDDAIERELQEAGLCAWEDAVPTQGPARGVYAYSEAKKADKAAKAAKAAGRWKGKAKVEAEGSAYDKGRGKGSFAEITDFYRNMVVHYNDYIHERERKKDDASISAEADLLFGSACSILRHSLTAFWYGHGNNDYGVVRQKGLLSLVFD